MRKVVLIASALLSVSFAQSYALKEIPVEIETSDWEARGILDQARSSAPGDTVCLGGDGTGNGGIVSGGVWDWESANNEPPEFFHDGDPVGNQFRDGWTLRDQTAKTGPSQNGAPHFNADGVYNFDYDATPGLAGLGAVRPGGWAHRATTHTNGADGNDGPNPLQGSWSIWIGTNLFLNPEHCAWSQRSGYGDGWSQGIYKAFPVPAGSHGAVYTIDFFHRYACEAGFDTAWVEVSTDGRFWNQVNALGGANGVYNGGTFNSPRPAPAGVQENGVNLLVWQGDAAGTLYVRFRLASDAYFSDQNEGGNFRFAWQVDDIQLRRGGAPVGGASDFETGYDNWKVASFEGFDFDLTLDATKPAGRITDLSTLSCGPLSPQVTCPDACALEGNVLMFADRDDCDLNDRFQDSYAVSRAFRIDPLPPLPPNSEGRIIQTDLYTDGGAGLFFTGFAFCYTYWPYNAGRCPFTPGAGAPGAGTTFNWSITNFATCDNFSLGVGAVCREDLLDDVSANLPAEADSVTLYVGAYSACRSVVNCDVNDNGTPLFDNLRFCVYNPDGVSVASNTMERYADSFPIANGSYLTQTARSDGAHSFPQNLAGENPLRMVRSDSAAATTGGANLAMFLRFAVERGNCQPNLGNPFFVAFPPSAPGTFPSGLIWHAAQMDTSRSHGSGVNAPGSYMTCFHENDARNGTIWPPSMPPPIEPCDDILPDNLFIAGTNVYYFFEARNATTGAVIGTFPAGHQGAPLTPAPHHKDSWLQMNVLPRLNPNCDGTQVHGILVISDYQSNAVPGRGTIQRERLVGALGSLGLEFDVYDTQGTNFTGMYNTIGRREDRAAQPPRPPSNGATTAQLEGYDCIWYQGGLNKSGVTLSDQLTAPQNGGQPSIDQQKLENWIQGCTAGNNRLLVLEGIGWASDIDVRTVNGPTFLLNRGVDVLADDYAQDLAIDDLRRCARIVGQGPGAGFDGEVFGSGCNDNINIDVIAAVNGGVGVANFVYSGEDEAEPVNCADDQNRAPWHAIVRRETGASNCQKSVSMSFSFSELYRLNCADECLFDDFSVSGEARDLVSGLFQWANSGCATGQPIGVGEPSGAPRFANALYQAQPNPANPSAAIRYTIAAKGRVTLRIFDVGGRLVRTLVDEVQEPAEAGFEVVWDGRNDQGQRVGSGVFLYQIDAPGFTSAKKLVILK